MKTPFARKMLATFALILAAMLIVIGARRSHKIFDEMEDDFGLLAYQRIDDRQLIIDTTFSGVLRKGDRLHSTYDRAQQKGKRACPT